MYHQMEYDIIRIPYFIQLSKESIHMFFQKYIDLLQIQVKNDFNNYCHGFVDPKAALPSDFCSLGLLSYESILDKLKTQNQTIHDSIISSLISAGQKKLSFIEVFPISGHSRILIENHSRLIGEHRESIDEFLNFLSKL